MPAESPFGKQHLQERIDTEFALARHIGIVVEQADEAGVVLCAPLVPNANYKGTAFGGSLFCVAVLAGWTWVTRYLDVTHTAADAVIQESTIKYLVPVHGILRAAVAPPPAPRIGKFSRMLQRAGRGRICLDVRIHQDEALAIEFQGVFAAALRRWPCN